MRDRELPRRLHARLPAPAALAAALGLALLAACASFKVSVDYDPHEDFSTYHTYAWLPSGPDPEADRRLHNPLLDARIRRAVDANLEARGYRPATSGTPDFYVAYYLSSEQKLDVYTVNRGYSNYWGYHLALPETHVQQYDQGTLIVDIADAREKDVVWRGVAVGRLREQPTPEETTERVNEVVAAILKKFPPGS